MIFQIVELLLAAGANVHLRNEDGESALAIAKENEATQLAELLVRYGAQ